MSPGGNSKKEEASAKATTILLLGFLSHAPRAEVNQAEAKKNDRCPSAPTGSNTFGSSFPSTLVPLFFQVQTWILHGDVSAAGMGRKNIDHRSGLDDHGTTVLPNEQPRDNKSTTCTINNKEKESQSQ